MRRVTRDGLCLALLWLAHGKGSIAQGVSQGIDEQVSGSTYTTTINHSSDADSISLMTSTTTLSVTATTTVSLTTPIGPDYPATCRSGTLNHITHSLPQQCPTSAWTAPTIQTTLILPTVVNSIDVTSGEEIGHLSSSISSLALPSISSGEYTSHSSQESTQSTNAITTAVESQESTTSGVDEPDAIDIDPSTVSSTHSASSSPSSLPVDATSIEPDPELETDSPLDNVNFLSFEEWKKQNLEKAGQSPDGGQNIVGEGRARQRPEIALDALGDEGEIELDFTGFGTPRIQDEKKPPPEDRPKVNENGVASNGPVLRSKDAGKTCKERSNYASFDCAATILKTNPETKSSSAILIENKDSYMLNPCSVANKFIIVELCDDILIDTIVLANYEFFSSIFRTFRVSVSDRYPVKADKWKELGIFEASNSRSVQAFLVPHSLIWARYLRIEFLTHFGTEYYCPVSLLRVHGTTMMEEFRHQEYINRGETLDDSEDEAVSLEDEETNKPTPIAQKPSTASIEADKSVLEGSVKPLTAATDVDLQSSNPTPPATAPAVETEISQSSVESSSESSIESTLVVPRSADSSSIVTPLSTGNATQEMRTGNSSITEATASMNSSALTTPSNPSRNESSIVVASPLTTASADTSDESSNAITTEQTLPATDNSASTATRSADSSLQKSSTASNPTSFPVSDSKAVETHISKSSTSVSSKATSSGSANTVQQPSSWTQNTTSSTASQQSHAKPSSSSVLSSPPPNPTTQESFFKSIHKRLQMLESNASLSLQYIESQSLLLRTAFSAVEKRQLKKTETFLANLNATVSTELDKFKSDYERLWEGVVIEMETQRRQSEREVLMISERLQVMAEELVWQKRVGVAQATLLMLCLGLVIFARSGFGGTVNNGLEVPLLQQLSRSKWGSGRFSTSAAYYVDGGMSPPGSPSPVSPDVAEEEVVEGLRSAESRESRGSEETWDHGGERRRRRRVFSEGDDDDGGMGVESGNEGGVSEVGTDSRPNTRDGSTKTVSSTGSRTSHHNSSPAIDEATSDTRYVSSTSLTAPPRALQGIYDEDATNTHTDEGRGAPAPTRSDVRTIDERDELGGGERDDEEEGNMLMPMETRSSPSTPGGTRDQQGLVIAREEERPMWPINEAVMEGTS